LSHPRSAATLPHSLALAQLSPIGNSSAKIKGKSWCLDSFWDQHLHRHRYGSGGIGAEMIMTMTMTMMMTMMDLRAS
jgi:hypothetical protein